MANESLIHKNGLSESEVGEPDRLGRCMTAFVAFEGELTYST